MRVWGVIALLFFAVTIRRMVRRIRRQVLISQGMLGSISASIRAIRSAVRNGCRSIIGGCNPCIHIYDKKSAICFRIHLKSPVGANVQCLAIKIQELIANNLREQFGLQTVGRIDVIIEGFRETGKCETNGIAVQEKIAEENYIKHSEINNTIDDDDSFISEENVCELEEHDNQEEDEKYKKNEKFIDY